MSDETTTTLDLVKTGLRAVVKDIVSYGWEGISRRLLQMGITPGAQIEVIYNENHGPLVIRVRGVEISLSRGIARRVVVQVLN